MYLVQSGHRYVKILIPSPFKSARSGSVPLPLDISNLACEPHGTIYMFYFSICVAQGRVEYLNNLLAPMLYGYHKSWRTCKMDLTIR